MSELIQALKELTADDRVIGDPAQMLVYESDGFTIAKARPAAVVFPITTEEVVRVVRLLAERDVQIVPRGSGTGLTGGCVAFENGVIVSTVRMNHILSVDLDNRVAHVEAGVRNTQLSQQIARMPGGSGYHFSPDPSSQTASTIGGNAATNAGGIHILKDFASSNHVLGLELVMPDGTVVEAGAAHGCYEGAIDLPGVICGSEGTLGIITKVWVRLSPKATSFRTIVGIFQSTEDACNAVSQIISAGYLPAAMEMMDGRMVQVVNDAFHMGFPNDAAALILTEIDGIDALLDSQMEQIVEIKKRNNAYSIDTSRELATRTKLWKARKGAFGAIGKISPSYCTQDACVPRSMLAKVLARVDEIGKKYGLTINNVFHAGDGNVHPIFLYDDRNEDQMRNTLEAAHEVLQYCIDLGGTLSGEHGVGVEKIALMPYQFDEATMELFQRIKDAFDPGDRINAGKLIPSDKVVVEMIKPARHVPQ